MIDRIEDLGNRMMDTDSVWWPFLYLRPAREQAMTSGFVAKMSLHFGPPIGIMIAGFSVARPHEASATQITLISILVGTFGFFAFYRLTFAALWNRRAARMTKRGRLQSS